MSKITDFNFSSAEKIADSLSRQASVASEHNRPKLILPNVEELFSESTLQTIDSNEMRRLLAERDALIARVGEEKKASLAYLMKATTADASREIQTPLEEHFLQIWEDSDRIMDEKAANLRTAAQATEQFEVVRSRLSNLIGEAKFLLNGTSSPIASSLAGAALLSSYDAFSLEDFEL